MPALTCAPLLTEGPSGRALLRIVGAEARDFLNALVSNDVSAASADHAVYAALLTPQGKFLHDMLVVGDKDGGLMLDIAVERAADLKRRLTLYKLRAKIAFDLLDWQGFALFGGATAPQVGGEA